MSKPKGQRELIHDLPTAIFQQAIRDLDSDDPEIRDDAYDFLTGGGRFDFWASAAGCNPEVVLEKIHAQLFELGQKKRLDYACTA